MRTKLLVPAALVLLAACASGARPPVEASPTAAAPAAPVIQVHDVHDIVSPPGDRDGVSRLADQVREMVVFIHGGEDPGATVTANGTAIVVVATPEMQRKVSNYLLRQRELVKPNGL